MLWRIVINDSIFIPVPFVLMITVYFIIGQNTLQVTASALFHNVL